MDASGCETGVEQVTDHKETTVEDEEQQTPVEESTNNDAIPGDDTDERTEEETGSNQLPAPTGVTDPVARHSFVDEEIYGEGDPPDEKKYQLKKIEISIPGRLKFFFFLGLGGGKYTLASCESLNLVIRVRHTS